MESNSHIGSESPPTRTTILGSFLGRGRPRNSSQSHIQVNTNTDHLRELSPSPPVPPSPNTLHPPRRRGAAGLVQQSASATPTNPTTASSAGLGLSNMLRRRRSAGNVNSSIPATTQPAPVHSAAVVALGLGAFAAPPTRQNGPATTAPISVAATGPAHRIRLVPHLDSRRSLRFDAIARDLREGDPALRIGRFTDRSGLGLAAVNALGSNKLAFRSKVVSRAHAEIWVESNGRFFIKDTKSSSGTFLNHVRLSPANTESRPYPIKDGDILQLGVDYQGGAEDIYKSVKIRIEVGREWQAAANAFNTNALKNLKSLAVPIVPSKSTGGAKAQTTKNQIPDCCICLFGVTIRQALFIAPCSHTFHYKCIRPMLEQHHPAFSCPLCRTFADLEEDVEVEVSMEDLVEEDDESAGASENGEVDSDEVCAAGREREAGAETEVEGEGGRRNLSARARVTHALPRLPDSEGQGDDEQRLDDDDEMVDLSAMGHTHGDIGSRGVHIAHGDLGGASNGGTSGNASPDFGAREGDHIVVHVEAVGEMGLAVGVVGMDGEDFDATVGGKRKR